PTDCWNLCCLCRRHHRIKTFARGWAFTLLPDGVRTASCPSGRRVKAHPRAKVLMRWCRRQRQQRFQQSVGPPWAWAVAWSMSQRAARRRQPGMRQWRSRTCRKRRWPAVGR
ncbi:hypothetical protein E9565_21755, partial [Blastococcus sp. KM273129]|nr:hypothetical protein [Blastococcus sp. KM273129]